MLYNELRPADFSHVIGQEDTLQPLKAQCREKNFSHAYMMYGKHGSGKTTVSRIMAKAVNCQNVTENGPCGECPACRAIAAGTTLDYVELDAASNNGVDDIRGLIEQTRYVPTQLKYKVFIIDEVHMLSTGAFNALLKTLEEPPEYVVFFLCTTEMHKVPRTIISRCQLHEFRAVDSTTIATYLSEICESRNKPYDLDALYLLAKAADGALRDALGLLEQCLVEAKVSADVVKAVSGLSDETASFKLIDAIATRNVSAGIDVIQEISDTGKNLSWLIQNIVTILSDLLLVLREGTTDHVFNTADYKEDLKKLAEKTAIKQVFKWIRKFAEIRREMGHDISPELYLQSEIISLSIESDDEDEILLLKRELNDLKALIKFKCGNINSNPDLQSEECAEGFEDVEDTDEDANPFEEHPNDTSVISKSKEKDGIHATQKADEPDEPVDSPKTPTISIPGFEIAGRIGDESGSDFDDSESFEQEENHDNATSEETNGFEDVLLDDGGFDFPGEW